MSGQPSTVAIKAAQAVNFFLQESASDPNSVDGDKYLKLIKLLWAADRLSLRNFGRDITGDHYSALRYGPVASGTLDLMKACKPDAKLNNRWISDSDGLWWKEHFEAKKYTLGSISDPGSDYLSQADILMLETAYELFRETGRFEASENISHIYPEWTRAFKPYGPVRSYDINPVDFFDDPENQDDLYFKVDPEILESARYFFNERTQLSKSIGINL